MLVAERRSSTTRYRAHAPGQDSDAAVCRTRSTDPASPLGGPNLRADLENPLFDRTRSARAARLSFAASRIKNSGSSVTGIDLLHHSGPIPSVPQQEHCCTKNSYPEAAEFDRRELDRHANHWDNEGPRSPDSAQSGPPALPNRQAWPGAAPS